MLSVPLKTTKDLVFARDMKAFIKDRYSEEEAERQGPAIARLADLRAQVQTVQVASSTALEPLAKYYLHTLSVETKFPASATGVHLQFCWNDSLIPRRQVTQTSWAYERASVLYNMAALESQTGATVDRSTDDGVKAAAQAFQRAAGMFTYIRDNVVNTVGGALPMDLSPQGLTYLVMFMQAQGQACFYEKASAKGMKSATLAKLAKKASELYAAARDSLTPKQLGDIGSSYPWSAYLTSQSLSFLACANWQAAKDMLQQALATTEGYGTEIAYLGVAERAARQAVDAARKASLPCPAAEGLLHAITARKAKAVAENNSVYMSAIPTEHSLPKIEGYLLAKPSAMPDLVSLYPVDDLFVTLVPVEVNAAVEEFRTHVRGVVSEQRAILDPATDAAKNHLAEKGLPGSVDAGETAAGLPDSTWEKVSKTQINGGLPKLEGLIATNAEKSTKAGTLLDECAAALDLEERQDATYRAQHGASWTCQMSSAVNSQLRSNHERYQGVLRVARESDASVQAKLASHRAGIEALAGTRDTLNAAVPSSGSGPEVAAPERARLKASLLELAKLLQDRPDLLKALQEAGEPRTLGQELAKEGLTQKEAVFTRFKAHLEPVLARIAANLQQQSTLLERIDLENRAFEAARVSDAGTVSRQRALQDIDLAVNKFDEILSNLKEGETFYGDIHTHVQRLKNNVDGFVAARTLEQKELLLTITGSAHGAAAVPPTATAVPPPGSMAPGAPGGFAPGAGAGFPSMPTVPTHTPSAPPATAPPPAAFTAPTAAPAAGAGWTCPACTFKNTKPEALACEICATPRE